MRFLNLNRPNGLSSAASVTVPMPDNLVFAVSIQRIVCCSVNRAPWPLWRCATVKSCLALQKMLAVQSVAKWKEIQSAVLCDIALAWIDGSRAKIFIGFQKHWYKWRKSSWAEVRRSLDGVENRAWQGSPTFHAVVLEVLLWNFVSV